jgi:hypothetical protein
MVKLMSYTMAFAALAVAVASSFSPVARAQTLATTTTVELKAALAAGAKVIFSMTVSPENAAEGSLMAQTFIAEPSNERRGGHV